MAAGSAAPAVDPIARCRLHDEIIWRGSHPSTFGMKKELQRGRSDFIAVVVQGCVERPWVLAIVRSVVLAVDSATGWR
jgi:hypothetical protein